MPETATGRRKTRKHESPSERKREELIKNIKNISYLYPSLRPQFPHPLTLKQSNDLVSCASSSLSTKRTHVLHAEGINYYAAEIHTAESKTTGLLAFSWTAHDSIHFNGLLKFISRICTRKNKKCCSV